MARRLFNKYKNFSLNTLPRLYRKIPTLILAGAAAFGFFCAGVVFALYAVDPNDGHVTPEFYEAQIDKHLELIDGYEELSDLYYYQGQNVDVITNFNIYETDPAEVAEAFTEAEKYRNKILVQQGRIMELRKNLGFIESKEIPNTQ